MALRDVTNCVATPYVPQIKLHPRFAPLIRRGQRLEDQPTPESFVERRAANETHIDLWIDGRIYPLDPATKQPPLFRTTKQYIEYCCEGENGMLGYTKRLSYGHTEEGQLNSVNRLQQEVNSHERCIMQLRAQCEDLQVKLDNMTHDENRHIEERLKLEGDIRTLEISCAELRVLVAQSDVARGEFREREEQFSALEAELRNQREACEKLQEKMKRMVKTPLGFRERVHSRKMKCLDELAPGSGHAKRRRTALRYQIQPSTVSQVQEFNKRQGRKRRLGGDGTLHNKTASVLASVLSAGEARKLAEQPRMSQATTAAAVCIFKKIKKSITEEVMLGTCDASGVSNRGYVAMCNAVKHRVQLVAPELKGGLLPSKHRLALLRKQMNEKLPQFIGDYYQIKGRRIIPEVRVGKKIVRGAKEVILDDKNNLFAELEVVQRSMVLFYDMTMEGNVVHCHLNFQGL